MKTLNGTAVLNLLSVSEVNGALLTPEVIIDAKLILTLPNSQQVELSVAEVLELHLTQIDPITGIEIYSELEL